MEHQVRHPEYIRKLRELNPSIVLLAYVTSQEITDGNITNFKNTAPLRFDLLKGVQPQWYLKNAHGEQLSFWPGTNMLNVSAWCPAVQGETWADYLARFAAERIASSGLWDGVLYDNVWQDVDWFTRTRGGIDIDQNARADDSKTVDTAWRKGYENLLDQSRRRMPAPFIIAGNVGPGHSVYASKLDISLFEHFPGFGWTYSMKEAVAIQSKNPSAIVIFNATSVSSIGNAADWKSMRFTLGSALLVDAFFSFDHGSQHAERWWYDEYGVVLGKPLSKAYSMRGSKNFMSDSVWRRDFSRGSVLVNPSNVRQVVKLGGVFQKIAGKQDAYFNDGSTVSEVSLEPHDAIIVLKKSNPLSDTVFTNNASSRTVSADGKLGQQETFFTDAAASGAPVFLGQVTGTDAAEGVKIEGARLQVWSAGKLIFSDAPYGDGYTGTYDMAVGKSSSETRGAWLAVTGKPGGGVVIYSGEGKKITTLQPFGSSFTGSVTAVFADVNRDGQDELVLGTGSGEKSEVVVLGNDFSTVVARFTPFDVGSTAGLSVGAITLSKTEETAIAVLLQGPKPVLRLFSREGVLKKEIAVKGVVPGKQLTLRTQNSAKKILRLESL
jgi:hypothetical protein